MSSSTRSLSPPPLLRTGTRSVPLLVLQALQPPVESSVRKPVVCKPVDRIRESEGKEEKVVASLLTPTFRGMLSDKIYRTRIGTVLNFTYDGSGLVNSVITNASLCLTSDFISFATVFDEFFILGFTAEFFPFSKYGYPVGFTLTSGVASTQQWNIPVGIVSLQHSTPAYSTLTSMAGNPSFRLQSTGDRWSHEWVNNENWRARSSANDGLTAVPSQGWCNTAATPSSAYLGQLQIFSPTTSGGVHSAGIGVILVRAEFLFRVRY